MTGSLARRAVRNFLALLLLAIAPTAVLADPPARVARLSYVAAGASFSPAGSDDWLQARINRPVWIGDRLWSGEGRIEVQISGASLRLAPRTLVRVLNFDDALAQFELTQGSVAVHARSLDRDEVIEINTPTFAFVTREEGDYRIDVERDRTAVSVRRGVGDVYGANVAYRIDRREQFVFYDTELRDYDANALAPPDAFDRWARERAAREDASASSRYVNPALVGYADLDTYGEWRNDTTHGSVWLPRVAADWAPYRNGHWSWIDPWGWTWIDDAPWGFVPAHYGRWAQIDRRWAWVPGPRDVRPVYSPALVAWVGGNDFSLSVSSGRSRGVAWFPLAPGEVWRPPYEVSREYFTRVNVTNTVVNQTQVINVYEQRANPRAVAQYRYRQAPGAITAVAVDTVIRSRPVQQNVVQVNNTVIVNAPVVAAPPAQPTVQSFGGGAPAAQARPPAESTRRPVIARSAPPASVPSLQHRVAIIQSQQGRPVDRAALDRAPQAQQGAPAPGSTHTLQPSRPVPGQAQGERMPSSNALRSNVRVVQSPDATPKAPPPPSEGARAQRGQAAQDGRAQPATPPAAVPTAPAAQAPAAPADKGRPDRPGNGRNAREATPPPVAAPAPSATPPGAPAPSARAPVAQPPVPPPAAAPGAAPPSERGRPDRPANGRNPREDTPPGAATAPTPSQVPPARSAPPTATPPQATPGSPPSGTPPSDRGSRGGDERGAERRGDGTPKPPPAAAPTSPSQRAPVDAAPQVRPQPQSAAPTPSPQRAPVDAAPQARPQPPNAAPTPSPQRAPVDAAPQARPQPPNAAPTPSPERAPVDAAPQARPQPPNAAPTPSPQRAPVDTPPQAARPPSAPSSAPQSAAPKGDAPKADAPKADQRRDGNGKDAEREPPGKGKDREREERGK